MGKIGTAALGLLLMTACAPTVPDSGSGVGFDDYSTYELRRAQAAAAERGRTEGLTPRISDEGVAAPAGRVDPGAPLPPEIAAAIPPEPGTLPAAPPASAGQPLPPPIDTAASTLPAAPAPVPERPIGMSDEQDFQAVSSRESIQSDAERLAENRANYQQVQTTAVPERPGASDTMVIDFALATTNAVGQSRFDRRGKVSQDRFFRACARFGSQDAAQEEFLKAGGPDRDPKYLDPDGDGFACFWDPAPFRKARLGAVAAPVAREVVPSGG